jgi:ectoine hydroxylase-related dioxygenase (phytanoyl-CoA dioxygenase family)
MNFFFGGTMTTPQSVDQAPGTESVLTAEQRRQIDEDGYTVLPDILSPQECDEWSQAVDEIWLDQRGKPHSYREEAGVKFVQKLLRFSPLFERCATEPAVVEAARAVLGPGLLLSSVNSRCVDPGYGNQPLHDLDRERGKPFRWCDALWCLDPFTARNGTRVLPGSHLTAEPFMSMMDDPTAAHPLEQVVVAPRGSVVLFNAHLIHAGSTNMEQTPRRSVQTQFCRAGEPTTYNWTILPDDIMAGLSPRGRELLGLTAE